MAIFRTSFVAVAALALALPMADAQAQSKPTDLAIVTSNAGGTFYPVGVGLAKVLSDAGMKASAEPGGGNSNVISVSTGKGDIGFTFSPTVVFAANAEGPFKEKVTNLRALATLYTNVTHVAVTEDSGVSAVKDLKGKPFASQPLSAGSATFFRMVLEANGLTEEDLDIVVRGGPAQGAQAVRDRRAIGFQATSGAPNGSFSEAFIAVPMKLLPISESAYKWINEKNPGLTRETIPAGTYKGVDAPVETIGAATILIVNQDMPDDHAHAIVKALLDNLDQFTPVHGAVRGLTKQQMPKVAGIELHPGAARAYKEAGL